MFERADALGAPGAWNFVDKYWDSNAEDMKNYRLRTAQWTKWNVEGYQSFLYEHELRDDRYPGITEIYRTLRKVHGVFDMPDWMRG